jgi:uncharacterized membrane protein YbhN (UPF0104 family)
VRVLVQVVVSGVLLLLLVLAAQRTAVFGNLAKLQAADILLAAALFVVACFLSSIRWQILLRHGGIEESLASLNGLYYIGMFFSLFLPTGVGGDAVRMFEVGRCSGRPLPAVLATFQERLLGLAACLLFGLGATVYYLPLFAPEFRSGILVAQVALVVGSTFLLYPALLLASIAGVVRRIPPLHAALRRLAARPLGARVYRTLLRMAAMPPLRLLQLVPLLGLAAATVLLNIAMHHVVGQRLAIDVGFLAYCLVVPLVTISRLFPLSLNGIGVGEGTYVLLLAVFAVPSDQALALGLTMLGLVSSIALGGGLLLAIRVCRGTWVSSRRPLQEAAEASGEDGLPIAPAEIGSPVGLRTAAGHAPMAMGTCEP